MSSNLTLSARKSTAKAVLFQLNPPLRVGEIIFDDEIPYGDEIRLDAGWVDLISSEAKPKISSALADFILAFARISLNRHKCLFVDRTQKNRLISTSQFFN